MNNQLNSALNIYRSGLAFFSSDETFIQSYAQFLLDHQQSKYDMRVTSLNELKKSEERFVKANDDRKMLRGMMGRMKRYMAEGVRSY